MPRGWEDETIRVITEDLQTRYAGSMKTTDIMNEIGVRSRATAKKFMDGVPFVKISERLYVYRTADVAKRIYEREVLPNIDAR